MPQPRRSCQQCDQRVSCGGPAENLRSNRDRSGGLCRISGSRAAERHGAKPSISLRTANSPCCSTGRAMCCWRAARSRALSAVGACSRSPPCSALSCSGCSWLRAAACLAEREPGCRLVPDAGGRRLNGAATARAAGLGAEYTVPTDAALGVRATPARPGFTAISLLPLLLLVALLVQSVADSRLLVEYGMFLLVIVPVKTKSSRD